MSKASSLDSFSPSTLRRAADDLEKRAGRALADAVVETSREKLDDARYSRTEARRLQAEAIRMRAEADKRDGARRCADD